MTGNTKRKFIISAGLLALLWALLSPGVRADDTGLGDLTITLPTITGNAGDTIIVGGTLTNSSSSPLFFSSDGVTFNNTALSGTADVAFNGIFDSTLLTIAGSATQQPLSDLFTVFIAPGTAPGLYDMNFYDLLGGIDPACTLGSCGVQLGTVEFSVNVQGPVPTSEPSTLLLLASGLLAGLLVIRRAAL